MKIWVLSFFTLKWFRANPDLEKNLITGKSGVKDGYDSFLYTGAKDSGGFLWL
ncbi:MAG: hypothetical protein CM15mP19_07620 [Gammaproteobacteria bacterium]|nr:MAG: hypothetical protein CM15mP19_07620 [Gammaproteobacteria bacterium]